MSCEAFQKFLKLVVVFHKTHGDFCDLFGRVKDFRGHANVLHLSEHGFGSGTEDIGLFIQIDVFLANSNPCKSDVLLADFVVFFFFYP